MRAAGRIRIVEPIGRAPDGGATPKGDTTMTTGTSTTVDVLDLESRIQRMYRDVAEDPFGPYHFEVGRDLAERLGYPGSQLDRIPAGAVDSFAGVGWFFDLAGLTPGEAVLDLGSGSGMDVFYAALQVGPTGRVVGRDMTTAQLDKSQRLASEGGFTQVEVSLGRIEDLPFADASFDCVISNGVINLSADKATVFAEAARVLRPGGRLVVADIVTGEQLPESVVCSADLWAACIGGAAQQDTYQEMITAAGLVLELGRRNPYEFISDRARGATRKWDVKSVSLVARKP